MTFLITTTLNLFTFIATLLLLSSVSNSLHISQNKSDFTYPKSDVDLIEFALNLEYLEAEYFLHGSLGYGLDVVAPQLADSGPRGIGLQKALLDPFIEGIVYQFALEEVGHLRAIRENVKGFPRPLINLSRQNFGEIMNSIFGRTLYPPFDPYINTLNYLISLYMLPYLGLTGYVGALAKLQNPDARQLVASLLAVEAGQDASIRTMLYERRMEMVYPYGVTVQEFTNKISEARNKLGKDGVKDEGLFVKPSEGAEGKTPLNILSAGKYSVGYPRTPEELLRIVYSSGDEKKAGGFFPKGANGTIARSYMKPSS